MSERLLPRSEVERLVGLRRSAIYDRMAAGTFPAPVQEPGTRNVRWLASEVEDLRLRAEAAEADKYDWLYGLKVHLLVGDEDGEGVWEELRVDATTNIDNTETLYLSKKTQGGDGLP